MTASERRAFSSSATAISGGVIWLGFVIWSVTDLRVLAWSTALLGFASLVIIPLLFDVIQDPAEAAQTRRLMSVARILQFPAAILLLISCARASGVLAALLAGPWIVLTAVLALAGLLRIRHCGLIPLWVFCRDAGLGFIAIGGAWILADRLGLHPLGFGTDIVQLTAVHFHFAGLVLPVVTALVLREFPSSRIAAMAGRGVLTGVLLVAIRITSSQLGQGHAMEFFAALVLASSAIVIGMLQLRLAAQTRRPTSVRCLWAVAGMSLMIGMLLAILYAARPYFAPFPWLDLPWMRALHGTANALGFALCAILGWRIETSREISA
jgi:YndJ-like protein